ncbi:helix-turn-helix transcriptional regulator, partial [Streptomyces sp. AK02-01A]|uniref:helix-turn-helix domain-containing protein n=1 Tax=Streptomyces sp. AK02-01A TaxID=3028648 RepID=UPI0029B2B6CB
GPAPAPPSRPEGGFSDTDNGPPTRGPAATLASALSHLHRVSGKSIRVLSEETGISPSYASRVFSGERLPTWKVTRKLALACDGEPDELRLLWNAARGYRVVRPTSLSAALRGLHLAAALPEPDVIRARAGNTLSLEDITSMLNGSRIPDWPRVDHLVDALRGEPETIRPLWEAAHQSLPPTTGITYSNLPASAFG